VEIREMGEKVAEALALQGKTDALSLKMGETKAQIKDNNLEIARLESLIAVRDTAVKKLAELEKEFNGTQAELESRTESLAKEGVILPLGKAQNKIVRM